MVAVTSLLTVIVSALMMTVSAPILLDVQVGASGSQNRALIEASEDVNSVCPGTSDSSEGQDFVRVSERLSAPPPDQAFEFDDKQVALVDSAGSVLETRSLDCAVEQQRVSEGGWKLSYSDESDQVVFG